MNEIKAFGSDEIKETGLNFSHFALPCAVSQDLGELTIFSSGHKDRSCRRSRKLSFSPKPIGQIKSNSSME